MVLPKELSARLSNLRKERLPMEGEITPVNLNPPRFKLITLSLLRPHVTPIQLQNGEE
jgi:hypothetical protein